MNNADIAKKYKIRLYQIPNFKEDLDNSLNEARADERAKILKDSQKESYFYELGKSEALSSLFKELDDIFYLKGMPMEDYKKKTTLEYMRELYLALKKKHGINE